MEEAIHFTAEGRRLYGIVHRPEKPAPGLPVVLMMVGGPQTRVGSHRAYVQIARALCAGGATVVRFDYRGVGDADGDYVTYTYSETSLEAALDWISLRVETAPGAQHASEASQASRASRDKRVVLWSLCDGAAASMVFGPRLGQRIVGMILCNPYVHNQQNRAESLIRYYYLRRILDKSFWLKLVTFRFNPIAFAVSFAGLLKSVVSSRLSANANKNATATATAQANAASTVAATGDGEGDPTGFDEDSLQVRMIAGIKKFGKPILFLLSTADITADQFRTLLGKHKELNPLFKNGLLEIRPIAGAGHTFSNLDHKRQVGAETLAALRSYL
jgi:exosortase A-associated hydrolase 1